MTPEQAATWNAAIQSAVNEYKNGIGAIMALNVKYAVTVEHIGETASQEALNAKKTS